MSSILLKLLMSIRKAKLRFYFKTRALYKETGLINMGVGLAILTMTISASWVLKKLLKHK